MTIDPGEHAMRPDPFSEANEPPKPGHGCFYYGCITAIVLSVLLMVVIALSGYFGYQAYLKVVRQYTSTTPVTLPKVEMSKEDRESLRGRIEAFKKALDEGEETEPLVLNGDELNVWLADESEVADRVYFVLEGDKLKGQISLPLDEFALPGLKGRYLNGKAAFTASLRDGRLDVRADSVEVNGQPLSQQLLAGFGKANLAEDAAKQPENAQLLNKLESLQIKDGKLVIKAKPAEERRNEPTKPEEPNAEPSAKPGDEDKPAEATKSSMPTAEPPTPGPSEKIEKPGDGEKPGAKPELP